MQTCQVCGKQNPAGVEYCEDCGAALKPAPSAQGSRADAPPQAAPTAGGAGPDAAPAPAGGGDAPMPEAGATAAPLPEEAPAPAPNPTPAATPDAPGGSAPGPVTAPAPSGGNPRLVARRYGALTGDELPLLGERLVVGRFDPETGPVDIDLSAAPEAEHISRQHGELYREADGRWLVRDLGSSNGVFVKGGADASFGPRITAPRELTDGDEIAFGNARFVFRRG